MYGAVSAAANVYINNGVPTQFKTFQLRNDRGLLLQKHTITCIEFQAQGRNIDTLAYNDFDISVQRDFVGAKHKLIDSH